MQVTISEKDLARIDQRTTATMEPDIFFQIWIPKKYNLHKGSKESLWVDGEHLTYRQACIREIRKHFPHLSSDYIDKRWGVDFQKRPDYMLPFLALLNKWYEIKELVSRFP